MSNIPLKLQGKVAVITGAGSGIGAATAIHFTQLGATIAILDLTKPKLEKTVAECQKVSVGQPKPLMVVGDVRDGNIRQKIIDETLKSFGKLDILVNNAGISKPGESIEVFDEIFGVNLRSVVLLTQLASPHLIKTKGCIINLSSNVTQRTYPGAKYYSMSKAAQNQFTKHAAQELGKHQVRVNSVSPGVIRTEILKGFGIKEEHFAKAYEGMSGSQVLGRVGEGIDIARAIAYLASDDASFVTGTDLLVDGGLLVTSPAAPSSLTKKD